jgi:hypothetical protein
MSTSTARSKQAGEMQTAAHNVSQSTKHAIEPAGPAAKHTAAVSKHPITQLTQIIAPILVEIDAKRRINKTKLILRF